MPYQLTEEQEMMRQTIRRLTKERVEPRADEIDHQGVFPTDMLQLFRENDLMGIPFPAEYGGGGGEFLTFIIVIEEIGKACMNSSMIVGTQDLGSQPIMIGASHEQKLKFLPKLASGEHIAAFALTEPSAGSDVAGMKTRALLDGDHYVLNGTKCFITNADQADVLSVFAKTDLNAKGTEGISAFIVEKGTPGLSIGKREKKMGNKALNSCEVIFEDCRVPRENLMRGEGQGWLIAMETLDKTRPMVAGVGVGLAQGALDYAVQYAKERVQFGKPIASFQAIQFKLADMAIEIEAARQLTYSAAAYIDEATRQPGWQKNKLVRARMTMLGSMCKCFATDVAMRTAIEAAQVLGGYGYMQDYPMERHIRDAKLLQIVEGTNEIQRTVISKLLLG